MQETANKQKRITLKTLHEMLDGMSVELAEKVHLLFMAFFRFSPSPLSQEGLHLSLGVTGGQVPCHAIRSDLIVTITTIILSLRTYK